MRISIMSFSQEKAIADKLDMNDLLILDWISLFMHSDKSKKIIINDTVYIWIKYSKMIDDLPIMTIKTRQGIFARLQKLVEKKYLYHKSQKNKHGSYSFYALTSKIYDLKNIDGCKREFTRGVNENLHGVLTGVYTKDNSVIDNKEYHNNYIVNK